MEMANTLAYYDMATMTDVKRFAVLVPGLSKRDQLKIPSFLAPLHFYLTTFLTGTIGGGGGDKIC
jgi:hypothetical protein